jgi:hypothetical protein
METFFFGERDRIHISPFPVTERKGFTTTLQIYGVCIGEQGPLLERDYSSYIEYGKNGVPLQDSKVGFPFIILKKIPECDRQHEIFCYIFNYYNEQGQFMFCNRSDKLFKIM